MPLLKYKLQFNGDVASALALASMLKDGWESYDMIKEDGYSWMLLSKII